MFIFVSSLMFIQRIINYRFRSATWN